MPEQQTLLPYTHAGQIHRWGGRLGDRDSDDRTLVHVTLPPCWTTRFDVVRGLSGGLVDQHGRARADIMRREHSLDGRHKLTWLDPRGYTFSVAEDGAPLILDSWATPAAMLTTAAERVQTFHQLTQAVRSEGDSCRSEDHTEHLAVLDAEHARYAQKLTTWTALLDQLVTILRDGWTIEQTRTAAHA